MFGSWVSEIFISAFRKKKINEYKELQNQLYERLELWRYDIAKDDVIVMMDYELCVGKFASYSIYIPKLNSIFIDELKKIKGYEIWYVSNWVNGIKLHCSSLRTRDQTTRDKIKVTEAYLI